MVHTQFCDRHFAQLQENYGLICIKHKYNTMIKLRIDYSNQTELSK